MTFGSCFNQPLSNSLDNLTQLQQLTWGYDFNQELNIPYSVKILKLNCNNRKITDYLPNTIEELYLDKNFNLDLNDLPSSIKILSFNSESDYNKDLNNLPQSLEKLYLPSNYNKKIINLNPNCQIIQKKEPVLSDMVLR